MKKKLSAHYVSALFIVFFICLCFFYKYDKIITYRPSSIHQYRQTDCLSFTYNYYKCHNNFFEPQLNQKAGKNFAGKNAAEFPILYYIVAQLWKLFGYHEWIYRLFFVLIMFSGLFALFKIFQYVLKDSFWQLILPLWVFSSPIMIYYGNNFITDVPGLSFAFIGWYFFVRYIDKHKLINLIFVFVFFCFAMLIKITSGISFLVLLGIFLFEWTHIIKHDNKPFFKKPLPTLGLFVLVGIIVSSWYLYSINYNTINETGLFQTSIIPIWNLKFSKIVILFRILLDYQLGNYFNTTGLLAVLAFFVIVLINFKKQNRYLILINIFIFFACISGMALWFQAYDEHDYHLINYLIFIPATCLTFFNFMQTDYPKLFHSLKLKIPVLAVVLICIYWGYTKIDARYADVNKKDYEYSALLSRREVDHQMYYHWIYPQQTQAFESITPYLRSIGITEKDLVFSFPDPSPSITLYLMGQWGVSFTTDNGADVLKRLNQYKDLNIKYFILGDSTFLKDEIIRKLLTKKIGQYQTVSIYDISTGPLSSARISCGAEIIDADSNYLKGTPDTFIFSGTNLRTDAKQHSGKYSIFLDDINQYGFTTKLKSVVANQIIKVSVWRYSESGSEAGICISGDNPDDLYSFNSITESGNPKGWQLISTEIVVPAKLQGKDLSVYVFNPKGEKKVYFDDIEISITEMLK